MKKVTSLGIRTRLTALLLAICMSIAVLPGSVIALENDSTNYSNNVNDTANEAVNETLNEAENNAENLLEPIIIEEDVTKRRANEKHFLCDDGSYIAISYPEAVHEEVNGEWVDVEYEVTENGGNISPVDEYIKVNFANNTNSAKLVKVEAGEYKISWTVEAETDTVNGIQKVKLSKDSKANIKTTKEKVVKNKNKDKKKG